MDGEVYGSERRTVNLSSNDAKRLSEENSDNDIESVIELVNQNPMDFASEFSE